MQAYLFFLVYTTEIFWSNLQQFLVLATDLEHTDW